MAHLLAESLRALPKLGSRANKEMVQATLAAPVMDGCTVVDDILVQLAQISPSFVRHDVVQFLMDAEKARAGRFIAGRKSKKSRMQWIPSLLASDGGGHSAIGDDGMRVDVANHDENVQQQAADAAPFHDKEPPHPHNRSVYFVPPGLATLKHTHHLRSDCQVEIELPADFTSKEADRLCTWLKSLPID